MKLLFVPGIKTFFYHYYGWQKDLAATTKIEAMFAKHVYFHWQHKRTEAFVQTVSTIVQTQKPDIILAHSFGGIIAKTALSRVQDHSVKLCVTMASPHTMSHGGVAQTKAYIKAPESINAPTVITYGGKFDPIVPPQFTGVPGSIHTVLPCEHLAFLFSKTIRKQVLERIIASAQ